MDHRSYRGLPPLAGLCSLSEAARPGMGIEECVARLKRFHYAFVRLHGILVARITAEPAYELKTAFSHHAHLCAEHATALRTRVGEMREPPLGLEEIPHPGLAAFFDEILAAPSTEELLAGVYGAALPALDADLAKYADDTNPLADAPSRRVLRFARLELADMTTFGEQARAAFPGTTHVLPFLDAAGGMDGTGPTGEVPSRRHPPFVYDPIPKRDERWRDPYNQGVNAEAFLYDEAMPAKAKALMMLFKRLREVDVPEMMSSILHETKGKPWEFTREMTRQLWDEARHAMLGEVGFAALGVDWTQARITHNWSLRLNTECTPQERHAVLYFIEQGLMTRTGKRYEWEVGAESGFPLVKTIQDFDWADEVLHAQIGRRWYIPDFPSLQDALAYGDRCWSRILSNWKAVLAQGLTKHENWWPALYEQACRAWGEAPDPAALAYD
ncbi:MAG: hypothetical protein K2W96_12640, partial [Gemmataceae bacterium]|nr:hypothetical protein [Gemmataceae bacterium]